MKESYALFDATNLFVAAVHGVWRWWAAAAINCIVGTARKFEIALWGQVVAAVGQLGSEANKESKKGVVLVSRVEPAVVTYRKRGTLEATIKAIRVTRFVRAYPRPQQLSLWCGSGSSETTTLEDDRGIGIQYLNKMPWWFKLPASHVIQTVRPDYDENSNVSALLSGAYRELDCITMEMNRVLFLLVVQKKRMIIIGKADAERTYDVVLDVVGHTFMPYERSCTNRSRKGKTNDPSY
ncbi:hypothetical protein Tco_0289301 [Tanacetum coccineum]